MELYIIAAFFSKVKILTDIALWNSSDIIYMAKSHNIWNWFKRILLTPFWSDSGWSSYMSLLHCVTELDGSFPAYGYADLPLDTLPLDPDFHDPYIPDMTYDPRQAYPEPL